MTTQQIFWSRVLDFIKLNSVHIFMLVLATGVIFSDQMWGAQFNMITSVGGAKIAAVIDQKKTDLLLSHISQIIPPFNAAGNSEGPGFLPEGTSFYNKPSLSNTIISGLPRDKITTYTVSEGETYWTVAYKFELDIDTLLWANGITDTNNIKAGQVLTILPVSGLLYTAVDGDTAQGVADKYGITADKIKSQNQLESNVLLAGTQLTIPGAKKSVPKSTTVPNYAGDSTYYSGSVLQGSGSFGWPINSGSRFFSQYFGWVTRYYKHTGVDLDWRNGLDIIAADRGTVVAVGYGWGGGYGNHVIIDHGNGYQTLYAHLSSVKVSVGQNVAKGQSVGVMGTTGISTGVHLHFEVRQNGVAINPLLFIR